MDDACLSFSCRQLRSSKQENLAVKSALLDSSAWPIQMLYELDCRESFVYIYKPAAVLPVVLSALQLCPAICFERVAVMPSVILLGFKKHSFNAQFAR